MNTKQIDASHFFNRSEIPGISEMHVEGEVRNLGIVKHFKRLPLLEKQLPESFSIAWVHLDPDEVLETHTHDVSSMIIAAQGSATSQGDSEILFHGGDAVYIPAWNLHGFTGGDNGFWGLSIQFNKTAIFETKDNPLTQYELQDLPPLEERQLGHFKKSALIKDENISAFNAIIPKGYIFKWHKIDSILSLKGHEHHQLFITLDALNNNDSKVGKSGNILWHTGIDNISLSSTDKDALILEIRFNPNEIL